MFMVSAYYHCYDEGYMEWCYASWALWITDRLVRLLRILRFGSKVAEVDHLEGNLFRVSISLGSNRPFDGAHGFVYFLTPYSFWQSHPFTMLRSAAYPGILTFTIRAKTGMTRYLKNKLERSEKGSIQMRVGVEGPYGYRPPLEKYSDVLLLVGGNGLPGPLVHALELSSSGSIENQSDRLVWVIRGVPDYEAYSEEIRALVSRANATVDIYVTNGSLIEERGTKMETRETGDKGWSRESQHSEQSSTSTDNTSLRFFYHRPQMANVISWSASQKKAGPLAIVACGPPHMCDEIRALSASAIGESERIVDLFEELQVW